MTTDRDLELGAALRRLRTPDHAPGFWEELEQRLAEEVPLDELSVRRRARRFGSGMWLLSAAAVVVVVTAAVAVMDRDDATRVVTPPATAPSPPARWTELADSPLSPRSGHLAVWTGERMLVWGGVGPDDRALGDGAAYDPGTDRWTPMADAPVKLGRSSTAVWTGQRMIVWGPLATDPGEGPPESSAGATYDPAADRWATMADAPVSTVGGHTAVWAGGRMIVWGGAIGELPVADGAAYDPVTDRWTALSASPLEPRYDHSAVSTGQRMLVWGGFSGEESPSRQAFADGAAYDPATDSWSTLPASPLSGRAQHAAVWTDQAMVLWGGTGHQGLPADGARYDPAAGAWRPIAPSPLTPRINHTAVAAGGRMIVWGGLAEQPVTDAGVYDPIADTWEVLPAGPLSQSGGPPGEFAAVWTGSSLLLWGSSGQEASGAGAAFRPAS